MCAGEAHQEAHPGRELERKDSEHSDQRLHGPERLENGRYLLRTVSSLATKSIPPDPARQPSGPMPQPRGRRNDVAGVAHGVKGDQLTSTFAFQHQQAPERTHDTLSPLAPREDRAGRGRDQGGGRRAGLRLVQIRVFIMVGTILGDERGPGAAGWRTKARRDESGGCAGGGIREGGAVRRQGKMTST